MSGYDGLTARRINIVEGPPAEPITLEQMWLQLRLDPEGSPPSTPFDPQLEIIRVAVRERMEQVLRRPLVAQTWRATYCRFPIDVYVPWTGNTLWSLPNEYDVAPRTIQLPGPPLVGDEDDNYGVVVEYFDQNNDLQTLPSDQYHVIADSQPACVQLFEGIWWPFTYWRQDAVRVTYRAGYAPVNLGGSPPAFDYTANIPKQAIYGMLLDVERMFNEQSPDQDKKIQETIDALVSSLRVYVF